MLNYKNLIYCFTCLFFSIIIGGAIYEHMAVVPYWSAAPPRSLSMFQGEYGLDPASFWQTVHPITIVLFLLTLIANWKSARRINILFSFVIYVLILVSTALYFVPELLEITSTPFAQTVDPELTRRAKLWETLSLLRLAVLLVLSVNLGLGMTKNPLENNRFYAAPESPAK